MCYWQHLTSANGGQLLEMLLESNHVAQFSAVHFMRGRTMYRLYTAKRSEHRRELEKKEEKKTNPSLCLTQRSLYASVALAADGGAEKMAHVKCVSVQCVKVHMGFSRGRRQEEGGRGGRSGRCRVSSPIPLAVRARYWYHCVCVCVLIGFMVLELKQKGGIQFSTTMLYAREQLSLSMSPWRQMHTIYSNALSMRT